jgi:hypothetical protein
MSDEPREAADDAAAESGEKHFLDDPEVGEAFERMLTEFARETDRGAVLIAADIVSAHLEAIIRALAPASFQKKQLQQMLSYPGLLATFAARADLCHMAGFVNATAYRSVSILRAIRNKAAHSQSSFRLSDHHDRLRELCNLGPGTALAINRFALDFMFRNLVESLKQRGVELEAELGHNPFSSPADIFEQLEKHPEAMAILEERLPRMELAFGVWLLLGLIAHTRKKLAHSLSESSRG